MKILVFILFGVSLVVGARECDPLYELPCDDKRCIAKIQWCDSVVDCRDQSDEKYCDGKSVCLMFHFRCNNGVCIPDSAVCDKYDDCRDGSDEIFCDVSQSTDEYDFGDYTDKTDVTYQRDSSKNGSRYITSVPPYIGVAKDSFSKVYPRNESNATIAALEKSVQYLMNKRDTDYGWGSFTPRAVVALSMANEVVPIPEKDKMLIQKQLNIQMLLDLMEYQNATLSHLALYINALVATCQDPRRFQGIDLVARLRKETDVAMSSNSSIPLATLTLCLNGKTTHADAVYLANMYNSKEFSRTGSRALIIMAMACIEYREGNRIFKNYMDNFITRELLKARTLDFYTNALFKQAAISLRYTPSSLENEQLADGSFGDFLATYYAIPVLMNSSLLDIRCGNWNKEGMIVDTNLARNGGKNQLRYSVWMTSGADVVTHTITVKYDGIKSLYDIMKIATSYDPVYKFLCEETADGKRVYSLAGFPDDVESGTSWFLYNPDSDNISEESIKILEPILLGVDKIFPADADHFIFFRKRMVN